MLNKKSKIFIAGHKGMVGSSICKKLKQNGYSNLIFNSKKWYSNLSEITINFIKILYIKFLLKLEYL